MKVTLVQGLKYTHQPNLGHMLASEAGDVVNPTSTSWTEPRGQIIFPKENLAALTKRGLNGCQTNKNKTSSVIFLELWFLHMKTMETEIKRIVQLLLCYYSPVIFTLLNDSALWIHATICPGPGHYFLPTLWQLCLHRAACLPCSLLADGIPPVPYGQINLPFQQSSGSYGAQWCLTWLALNLMNLKAIWAGPFICSFLTPHGEYIFTHPLSSTQTSELRAYFFVRRARVGGNISNPRSWNLLSIIS